jgi:hypothetical protein
MAFFTGRTGSVIYNGRKVAKIRDWSVDTTVELLSTNTIDSVVNTFTPGVKGATGSATMIYYRLEPGESATLSEFSEVISNLVRQGAITESNRVQLDLNVGTSASDNIVINAYITQAQIAASTGELSVVPIQFTMDGDFVDVFTPLAR